MPIGRGMRQHAGHNADPSAAPILWGNSQASSKSRGPAPPPPVPAHRPLLPIPRTSHPPAGASPHRGGWLLSHRHSSDSRGGGVAGGGGGQEGVKKGSPRHGTGTVASPAPIKPNQILISALPCPEGPESPSPALFRLRRIPVPGISMELWGRRGAGGRPSGPTSPTMIVGGVEVPLGRWIAGGERVSPRPRTGRSPRYLVSKLHH